MFIKSKLLVSSLLSGILFFSASSSSFKYFHNSEVILSLPTEKEMNQRAEKFLAQNNIESLAKKASKQQELILKNNNLNQDQDEDKNYFSIQSKEKFSIESNEIYGPDVVDKDGNWKFGLTFHLPPERMVRSSWSNFWLVDTVPLSVRMDILALLGRGNTANTSQKTRDFVLGKTNEFAKGNYGDEKRLHAVYWDRVIPWPVFILLQAALGELILNQITKLFKGYKVWKNNSILSRTTSRSKTLSRSPSIELNPGSSNLRNRIPRIEIPKYSSSPISNKSPISKTPTPIKRRKSWNWSSPKSIKTPSFLKKGKLRRGRTNSIKWIGRNSNKSASLNRSWIPFKRKNFSKSFSSKYRSPRSSWSRYSYSPSLSNGTGSPRPLYPSFPLPSLNEGPSRIPLNWRNQGGRFPLTPPSFINSPSQTWSRSRSPFFPELINDYENIKIMNYLETAFNWLINNLKKFLSAPIIAMSYAVRLAGNIQLANNMYNHPYDYTDGILSYITELWERIKNIPFIGEALGFLVDNDLYTYVKIPLE